MSGPSADALQQELDALKAQFCTLADAAGERESIGTLVADREEATVYLKVAALVDEAERLKVSADAVRALIAQWRASRAPKVPAHVSGKCLAGNHDWCHNRNFDESKCLCACHFDKGPATEARRKCADELDALLSAAIPLEQKNKQEDLARSGESIDLPASVSTRPPTEAICERCQMRLPERLVKFGVGVRGGTAAWCAACARQPGAEGEAKRQEVIAIRKARR